MYGKPPSDSPLHVLQVMWRLHLQGLSNSPPPESAPSSIAIRNGEQQKKPQGLYRHSRTALKSQRTSAVETEGREHFWKPSSNSAMSSTSAATVALQTQQGWDQTRKVLFWENSKSVYSGTHPCLHLPDVCVTSPCCPVFHSLFKWGLDYISGFPVTYTPPKKRSP